MPADLPGAGPALESSRLVLEPWEGGDVEALHAILLEPAVRRYLLDGVEVSRAWVEGWVRRSRDSFRSDGFGLWCVRSREQAAALTGFCGLGRFPGTREPQLVYGLASRFWGRGYATEAAATVTRYAFERLGFARVLASTDPPNRDSIRVMERLGMRFLEAGLMEGQRLVFYTLSREAWDGARPRSPTPPPAAPDTPPRRDAGESPCANAPSRSRAR